MFASTRFVATVGMLAIGLAASSVHAEQMTVDGVMRTFALHIPSRIAQAKTPAPLIIALHGGMGSGAQMRGWLGLDAVADRLGFIVAYPDGLSRNWNDGRTAVRAESAGGKPADDVAFLSMLAKILTDRGQAKAGQVFVTGASNGGMMAFRLACETEGVFAGYAAMIANVSVELEARCQPRQPAAMLIMNGTADPLMPFGGGNVARNGRGTVTSTRQTFARWQSANRCHGEAPALRLPDLDPGDGSYVEVISSKDCAVGAATVLYTIVGGGHQMPSRLRGSRPMIDRFLGPNNRDIEAAEVVARFFMER